MSNIENQTYSTHDWDEIIWLILNRQPIVRTVRERERQVRFHFQDPDTCRGLVTTLTFANDERVRVHRDTLEAIRVARTIVRKTP